MSCFFLSNEIYIFLLKIELFNKILETNMFVMVPTQTHLMCDKKLWFGGKNEVAETKYMVKMTLHPAT